MNVEVYQYKNLEEAKEKLTTAISSKKFLVVVGNCRVTYEGRGASKIDYGDRVVIIKPDGALLVHRPRGYSPVNWQPDSKVIEVTYRGGEIIVRSIREKPREVLEVFFKRIDLIIILDNMIDTAEFIEYLDENEIRDYLVKHPEAIEKGLHIITIEKPVEPGFIDIYARDSRGRLTVIEVKRVVADKRAVMQLYRYLEAFKKYNPTVQLRGILVAPSISHNAAQLLASLGLEYKRIDIAKIYREIKREVQKRKDSLLSFLKGQVKRE